MGKMAWVVADALDYGKNKGKDGDKVKNGAKPKKGSKEAADAKRSAMDSVLKNYGLVVDYTAAAQRMLNGPMCERVSGP